MQVIPCYYSTNMIGILFTSAIFFTGLGIAYNGFKNSDQEFIVGGIIIAIGGLGSLYLALN